MPDIPTFDMKPVYVPDEVLEGFKKLPTATVYGAVRSFGSTLCVCEGLRNFTPGKKMAARAKTLRFLPNRDDLKSDTPSGENAPLILASRLAPHLIPTATPPPAFLTLPFTLWVTIIMGTLE